jgi:hypothetical protein
MSVYAISIIILLFTLRHSFTTPLGGIFERGP